jgi:hypothetical protein
MYNKEITLSVIERVMTVFFENPKDFAVNVQCFVPDEPAGGH